MTNHEAGGANNNPEAEGSKEGRSETALRTFGQEALKSLALRSSEPNVDWTAEPGADESPATPDADTSTSTAEYVPTTTPLESTTTTPTLENGDGITETITTTTRAYEDSDDLPHTVESTPEDYSSSSRTVTTSEDLSKPPVFEQSDDDNIDADTIFGH